MTVTLIKFICSWSSKIEKEILSMMDNLQKNLKISLMEKIVVKFAFFQYDYNVFVLPYKFTHFENKRNGGIRFLIPCIFKIFASLLSKFISRY